LVRGAEALRLEEAPLRLDRTRWPDMLVGLRRAGCWRPPLTSMTGCTWRSRGPTSLWPAGRVAGGQRPMRRPICLTTSLSELSASGRSSWPESGTVSVITGQMVMATDELSGCSPTSVRYVRPREGSGLACGGAVASGARRRRSGRSGSRRRRDGRSRWVGRRRCWRPGRRLRPGGAPSR